MHKTIYSGLRISEMTLSNQSHFPRFFGHAEPRFVPSQFRIVLSRNWLVPGKTSYGVTKSRKMTYRGLANSGLRQLTRRNWLVPGKSSILLNLQRGFDEASCLKSSSGDKRFRLVISRNWSGPGKSSSGE